MREEKLENGGVGCLRGRRSWYGSVGLYYRLTVVII